MGRSSWEIAEPLLVIYDPDMIRTVEAVIDDQGRVRLVEEVAVSRAHRALVTILDEDPLPAADETARLSEAALAEDWDRPEENAAWLHLQGDR